MRMLGVLALTSLTLAACGSDDTAEDDATPAAAGSTPTATATAAATEAAADKTGLALGDEAELKGQNDELIKVTVTKIGKLKNPATERPKAGKVFMQVRATLENVGEVDYDDSLLNGSRLVTEPADAANPSILLDKSCASKGAINFKLAPGKTKKVCLPFQVDKKATVSAFQFKLNSGYGPEMGEWTAE